MTNPVEEGLQAAIVNVAHQHAVNLDLAEACLEGGVDAAHHLMKFILAGDGVELTGVKTVDADVD